MKSIKKAIIIVPWYSSCGEKSCFYETLSSEKQ